MEIKMKRLTQTLLQSLALAGLLAGGASAADGNAMAKKFAEDRLAFFAKGDVDSLVSQYASDAVVITPMGVLRGRGQIRPMIAGIIAEFAQPGVKFNLISQAEDGPVVAFTWSAQTARNIYELGAETYVLEDGVAKYQTFAARSAPR
jgi:ketosteroid isomerase-like protein